jgi:hypothetical protein
MAQTTITAANTQMSNLPCRTAGVVASYSAAARVGPLLGRDRPSYLSALVARQACGHTCGEPGVCAPHLASRPNGYADARQDERGCYRDHDEGPCAGSGSVVRRQMSVSALCRAEAVSKDRAYPHGRLAAWPSPMA